MSESRSTSPLSADPFTQSATDPRPGGRFASYRLEHQHPVNHFLHVAVGWPMVAISILMLPFRPLWSALLFVIAYAIMFFGHFVFERNTPTIFKQPNTPFVIAWAVIRELWNGLLRLARPRHVR